MCTPYSPTVYRGISQRTASPTTTGLLIRPTILVLDHMCKMCVIVTCNVFINVWEPCFAMILEINKCLRCELFDKFGNTSTNYGWKINDQVKWNILINKIVFEHTFVLEFTLFSLWHEYLEQVNFSVVSTLRFL